MYSISWAVDKAIDILIKNLDNKDEKIRLAAAMQIARMTRVQENLKNKFPKEPSTIQAKPLNPDLIQALDEVTKELGF